MGPIEPVTGAAPPTIIPPRGRCSLPSPTARCGHTTRVQRLGNRAQRARAGALDFANDRKNVRRMPVYVRLHRLRIDDVASFRKHGFAKIMYLYYARTLRTYE